MGDIYEEVARDLFIEYSGYDNFDYHMDRWNRADDSIKAPYREAAERLVNKYQERFLGGHGAEWGDDEPEPMTFPGEEFVDEKSEGEGPMEPEYQPTLQPIFRITVEGLV